MSCLQLEFVNNYFGFKSVRKEQLGLVYQLEVLCVEQDLYECRVIHSNPIYKAPEKAIYP